MDQAIFLSPNSYKRAKFLETGHRTGINLTFLEIAPVNSERGIHGNRHLTLLKVDFFDPDLNLITDRHDI